MFYFYRHFKSTPFHTVYSSFISFHFTVSSCRFNGVRLLACLDRGRKMQISTSRPWRANQANQRNKSQNWKKRTTSDHTAPQRSLTASRGHFCTLEARPPARAIPPLSWSSAPRSETDQLEQQRRVRHCSSELYMKLACLYSREDRELK